ncbi:MAG: glycosyltransferase [Anaerolineales bacterium]|nr:glycosyltransferase [Anaerolineales bacterium]
MTDTQPLVSIVTPSYNQSRFLQAAMDSVLGQSYPNIEYIVIDGGSSDESPAMIAARGDQLAYWVSESDKGQTNAINKGFDRAKGEILAWLNSDDTYEPHAVAQAVEYLSAHPQVGLVYGEANFIDEHGRVIGRFPAAQTDHARLRQGYVHIPQQAAFWRADLWRRVGPLDENLYFAMDYDLWLKLTAVSEARYLPGRVWANFRLHGDSKTIAEDERGWDEMVQIHYRDGGSRLSIITIKYVFRKLLAPLVTWRRRSRVRQAREYGTDE